MGTAEPKGLLNYNYGVRIDQHGIEPWGDQFETLINLVGFSTKIFDIGFSRDCTRAYIFMQTAPAELQYIQYFGVGLFPIIMEIELENP